MIQDERRIARRGQRVVMFGRKRRERQIEAANPLASRVVRGDDRPTQPIPEETSTPEPKQGRSPRMRPADPAVTTTFSEEPETRLVTAPDGQGPCADAPAPVGVLLIVQGAGTGQLVAFGTGRNAIGRADGSHLQLDFGDPNIARERHAIITFDDKNGHFYLQPGDGPALTYLNGAPLLEPQRLTSGARFVLGDTGLLFRPLIGDDFNWSHRDA